MLLENKYKQYAGRLASNVCSSCRKNEVYMTYI